MSSELPQQKQALEQASRTATAEVVPVDENGWPLTKIQAAAAELVPTKQYGNVTVGPIMVSRWVRDGEADEKVRDEKLLEQIHRTQSLAERAVAEDRETVHNMIRQSEQGRYSA